jgi:hypothetical protein
VNPQVLAIVIAAAFFVAVILLLRSYVLPEKYAVLWLLASVVAIVLSAWPALLDTISDFFGIEQPINLLFVGAFFVVLSLARGMSCARPCSEWLLSLKRILATVLSSPNQAMANAEIFCAFASPVTLILGQRLIPHLPVASATAL